MFNSKHRRNVTNEHRFIAPSAELSPSVLRGTVPLISASVTPCAELSPSVLRGTVPLVSASVISVVPVEYERVTSAVPVEYECVASVTSVPVEYESAFFCDFCCQWNTSVASVTLMTTELR